MGNQVRVCTAACQDPILPTEIRSRMSLHSSTEPNLFKQLWVAFNCQHS